MSILSIPTSNWLTPTMLGDHGSVSPHRVIVRLKNGNTIGGVLRVAQADSIQLTSGNATWTFFASEWDAVEIHAPGYGQKVEYLVSRKYPSFPAKADKILFRRSSPVTAQAEAIQLSRTLKGGAVSVMKTLDTRIVSYDMFEGGLLVRYGRELSDRTWTHFDVQETTLTVALNGGAK